VLLLGIQKTLEGRSSKVFGLDAYGVMAFDFRTMMQASAPAAAKPSGPFPVSEGRQPHGVHNTLLSYMQRIRLRTVRMPAAA
jgi:hypothetical protein